MNLPSLIAFDFDGVICDGLIEYFETAWQAYCQLFQPDETTPPDGLAERFYPLRPVIETGWEMPVLVEALIKGAQDQQIIDEWPEMALPYLEAANLTKKQSVQALDGVRDQKIQSDLQGWLDLHRFYPGVVTRLKALLDSDLPIYIVSTKEGRFIQALLSQSGVDFPSDRIFGKEVKRPKYETLRSLKETHNIERIWFIEDRLPALKAVAEQSDLIEVQLFLADWGYNLKSDRVLARQDDRIHLLSLQQVVQPFDQWM
ncbi:haloacid dehalogenase-like hydrolase, putative [Synechococcus sp. PCC 7335]|uniref:HAD family hydrolase n=1 Tax=Synechococcus sp. (strain ATCC 29403 / PCC 7335) TaxID=91464 RepID=UPI00017EB0F9|nr:HAD family hydrolase [Synechococcus sp. PCC 7335]EDX84046.1 haloacid dehalogenase-like hydrolase, putative [Synechococcus sp. PCC 7335]